MNMHKIGALAVVGAALLTGCGSAPSLTVEQQGHVGGYQNNFATAALEISESGQTEPSTYAHLLDAEDYMIALCRKNPGTKDGDTTIREDIEDDASQLAGGSDLDREIADRLNQVARDGCK